MTESSMDSLSLVPSEPAHSCAAGLFMVYMKDLSKGLIGFEFRPEQGETLRGSLSYWTHSGLLSYKLSHVGTFSVSAGMLKLDPEKAGLQMLEVPVDDLKDLRTCAGVLLRWD